MNKIESNYIEKIKNVDSKDLHKFYENEYNEYEKYFKQQRKSKIIALENLKDSISNDYLRKKLEDKIKYYKESI